MSFVNAVSPGADLSALFGIELDVGGIEAVDVPAVICGKCKGKGKFISYTGRAVGPCFTCTGTGLTSSAGVILAAGDCAKCAGTGEWSAGRPCFACNGTGKIAPAQAAASIDVSAISAAFAAAISNGIKRPKLRLASFVFSRAPETGKNAGSIYVKSGENYLGKVTAGEFHSSLACDDATKAQIVAVASDPHNAAKAYGLRTGSCSCCNRELTNGVSIDLGIGPICRDKFGW